jgi:hypothetical protein
MLLPLQRTPGRPLRAFKAICSVQPFISSMNKLAAQNLAERTPARGRGWSFIASGDFPQSGRRRSVEVRRHRFAP